MELPNSKTTRRSALRQLAGSATTVLGALPILGQNPPPDTHHSPQPVTKQEAAYTYRFFSPQQLETLDALGETIIPADHHSPGAKAARVSEYIDAIVADSPARVKTLWIDGIAAFERVAQQRFQRTYTACSFDQQTEIMTAFAGDEQPGRPLGEDFFAALKRATIDGYYTSAIGIFQDLQYQGNKALPAFPGCEHNESGSDHS
jgi:gluconate 2-dehydrogenase gamma chain